MTDYKNEDIDIFYVLKKIREILGRWNALVFRGVNFVIKRWYIVIVLIVAGVILGYYEKNNVPKDKKAKVLLRINFDSVYYVYTSLELLNEKLVQGDVKFLKKINYPNAPNEIREIKLKPIVTLYEIIDQYDPNDHNFEAVVRNIEFKKDDEEMDISETLTNEYKYHILEFEFTPEASTESIQKILHYLNSSALLSELKDTTVNDIKERIAYNETTIKQIDQVLDNYTTNESLKSPSEQVFVVDKNFSINNIIEKKIDLLNEIEKLNEQLVYSKDIVVAVSEPMVINLNRGFIDKKTIFFPVVFVGGFLLLALLRAAYISLRDKAIETENKVNG